MSKGQRADRKGKAYQWETSIYKKKSGIPSYRYDPRVHGTPYFFRFESNPTISRQLDGNTAESFLAYCHARGIETVWYPTQNKGFGRMQSPTKRVLYAIQARANRCGMSATEELGMTALPSSR